MYKTLLMAVALIVPVMAQEAPEGSRPSRPHGSRPIAKNLMAQKLLMDKYDANKDGKLDDAEKVALKADAEKLKEARKKERLAKWDKDGDGKFNDEEKAAMKAEHEKRMAAKKERMEALKGKEGEAKADDEKKEHGKRDVKGKRHPGSPRGEYLDSDMIIVGQDIVLKKYDTDKDGRVSNEEHEALESDLGTRGELIDFDMIVVDLLMDKYDVNKDGKLDDSEKVALKADAEKVKEARQKERLAKWDKDGDGKLNDEEKAAMKAEHEKRVVRANGIPRGPRGEFPDFDMIIVGQALVLEKYDTDKDGKVSKEENEALKSDLKAARRALKDAGSKDAPEPPPAPEKE